MSSTRQLPYLPGLDGLRALAVVVVVLFHAGQGWLPGGFLGVEVFFVISGYIITAGLLAEWRESGTISVLGFWGRRARRLLPALFTLLGALLGFAALARPEELEALRADSLAAFGYVTNWALILDQRPYFEQFERPPLLQHLWSLAVEEQFYIVWPLLLAGMLKVFKARLTAAVILVGALASFALMAVLYADVYETGRVYYGTDTRAGGLLLGSVLAFVRTPGTALPGRMALLAPAAGVLGLLGLVALTLRISQYEPMLYQGGFLATGLATAAVIVAVTRRESFLSRLIGVFPLRWIGTRSYGIYLWHWPLLLLTDPRLESGALGLAWRLALVLVISEASYRMIETPVRRGLVGRLLRSEGATPRPASRYRRALGLMTAGVGAVALTASLAAVNAPSARASRSVVVSPPVILISPGPVAELPPDFDPAYVPPPPPEPEPEPIEVVAPPPPPPPPPRPVILPVAGTAAMPPGVRATAVGDSVMLGASRQMAYVMGNIEVDSDVGRQTSTGIEVLRYRAGLGEIGDVVVIGFGSNGGFSARQFDQIMEVLGDVKLVVFVNVRVPRAWEGPNNGVIARGVEAYPNAVMVDWYGASEGHPELFGSDGVHLTGQGIRLYASLIADAIITHWR